MNKTKKNLDDSGIRNLIAAVIRRAIIDLKSKNEKIKMYAKSFLLSEDCKFYCEILNVSHNKLSQLVTEHRFG